LERFDRDCLLLFNRHLICFTYLKTNLVKAIDNLANEKREVLVSGFALTFRLRKHYADQ